MKDKELRKIVEDLANKVSRLETLVEAIRDNLYVDDHFYQCPCHTIIALGLFYRSPLNGKILRSEAVQIRQKGMSNDIFLGSSIKYTTQESYEKHKTVVDKVIK